MNRLETTCDENKGFADIFTSSGCYSDRQSLEDLITNYEYDYQNTTLNNLLNSAIAFYFTMITKNDRTIGELILTRDNIRRIMNILLKLDDFHSLNLYNLFNNITRETRKIVQCVNLNKIIILKKSTDKKIDDTNDLCLDDIDDDLYSLYMFNINERYTMEPPKILRDEMYNYNKLLFTYCVYNEYCKDEIYKNKKDIH